MASLLCFSAPSSALPLQLHQLKLKTKPKPFLFQTKPSFPRRLLHVTYAVPSPEVDAVETPLQEKEQQQKEAASVSAVAESVKLLKEAAKTRKVSATKVLSALSAIKKAKLDPSGFFETLGGTESPGRTWMLIFTAQGKLEKGGYFPLTAVQRFDAAGKRIENGIYLGPVGCLTFEGRLSWKNRILAFVFECVRIKIGPFGPLEISLMKGEDREPSTKDPFFVWFYVDQEIAVAQGRGGGTAFWCRCRQVSMRNSDSLIQ